jgi:hypothetical protein
MFVYSLKNNLGDDLKCLSMLPTAKDLRPTEYTDVYYLLEQQKEADSSSTLRKQNSFVYDVVDSVRWYTALESPPPPALINISHTQRESSALGEMHGDDVEE